MCIQWNTVSAVTWRAVHEHSIHEHSNSRRVSLYKGLFSSTSPRTTSTTKVMPLKSPFDL